MKRFTFKASGYYGLAREVSVYARTHSSAWRAALRLALDSSHLGRCGLYSLELVNVEG